jgi:toxin CptA
MITIAVTAVVLPSRLLRLFVGIAALVALIIAFLVGWGLIGELSLMTRGVIAGICVCAAWSGFSYSVKSGNAHRIDISATGKIRLMMHQGPNADLPIKSGPSYRHDARHGMVVRLLDGSTLWPQLMLLLLQAEDGGHHVIPILPDSIPVDQFRALAAACRWIAGHNEKAEAEIF